MIYDVRHLTTYVYGAPVPFARCVLRLFPRADSGQIILSSKLEVTPRAAERWDGTCFFGNAVTTLTIDRPHRELKVEVRSRVDVRQTEEPTLDLSERWEAVRDLALASTDLSAMSPVHAIFPSRLVTPLPEIVAYTALSFPADRPILESAVELMNRIRRDFAYDPTSTIVSTPLEQAFRQRRGVCQDFAHVMIAGLRGLGIPAVYVSGYIRTIPPPGRKRLVGADATHAWVSVWCGPHAGWIGLDPTNAIRVGQDHIQTARGRDYADVSPIAGVIVGSGGQSLEVEVDVEPVG